jgi:hypothetical protein
MAFTSAQLSALETAAATGQLSVQIGDRRIQYQSLADLLQAIDIARRDVAGSSALRSTRRYPEFHSGR